MTDTYTPDGFGCKDSENSARGQAPDFSDYTRKLEKERLEREEHPEKYACESIRQAAEMVGVAADMVKAAHEAGRPIDKGATRAMKDLVEMVDYMKAVQNGTDAKSAESLLIDFTEPLPPPESVYERDGTPIFTRGNIGCITGKAKSRKSFLVAMIAAKMLRDGLKVLLIDTEQAKYDVQRQGKRILATAELNPDEQPDGLKVYFLKETPTKERKEIAESLIRGGDFDAVFIDGVKDLIRSINDEGEATDICDLLMNLASSKNLSIVVVLHENKGDNNNVRGHIGTEVVNKSETIIEVSRDTTNNDISNVEWKHCRHKEFAPFSFKVDDRKDCHGNSYGLPVEAVAAMVSREQREYDVFKGAFTRKSALTHTELTYYLTNTLKTREGNFIKESGAKARINKATEGHEKCDFNPAPLTKDKEGLYTLNPKAGPIDIDTEIEPLWYDDKDDEAEVRRGWT